MKRWVGIPIFILCVAVFSYWLFTPPKHEQSFLKYTQTKKSIVKDKLNLEMNRSERNLASKIETKKTNLEAKDARIKEPKQIKKSFMRIKDQEFEISDEQVDNFESLNGNYARIKNLIAIPKSLFSKGPFKKLGEFNGHVLIESSEEIQDLENSFVVLKNKNSGGVAIFTGILKVKFIDYSYAQDIHDLLVERVGKDFDFNLNEEAPHIDLAYYKFSSYEETIAVHNLLLSDSFRDIIIRSTIDLIEWRRVN